MISYRPRPLLRESSSSISENTSEQPTPSPRHHRVPSDDDPTAFQFISSTTMLRRSSSAQASSYGGLPVYSSSTPKGSSGSRRPLISSYSLTSSFSRGGSSTSFSSPRSHHPYTYGNEEDYDCYSHRKSSSTTSSLRPNFLVITSIITALFYLYATYRTSSISTQLTDLSSDLRTTLFDHNQDAMALSEAQALEKELQGEIDYHNKQIARRTLEMSMNTDENELLLKKEEGLRERVERMESDIAEISRMEAIERFGEGPHRVEFTLQFMNDAGSFVPEVPKSRMNKFVIELAPLSLMPHSVLHFLEMIDHSLWDGAAFVHHVDHVVQAVPTAFRTAETMKDTFEEAGLSELAFQEYHEEYPHDTYTVGFSGRPGGLEFYINTQDNSLIHGPGGQKQHALHEEGDPCFGKVISGQHVVDRMNQKGITNKREINIIGIEKAVLLPQGTKSHLNPYKNAKKVKR